MNNDTRLEEFYHEFPIQIRWADLDALGHVNNATYLTYFEIARGKYIQTICPQWNWTKDMFLIASASVHFEKELRLTARNVCVKVQLSKIGRKSFELNYLIVSQDNEQQIVHASGTTTQVMIDMQLRQTIEIPNWIRNLFDRVLKG